MRENKNSVVRLAKDRQKSKWQKKRKEREYGNRLGAGLKEKRQKICSSQLGKLYKGKVDCTKIRGCFDDRERK
jgi:hypothetical protein